MSCAFHGIQTSSYTIVDEVGVCFLRHNKNFPTSI